MKNGIHNKGLLIAKNFFGAPQHKPEPVENVDLFALTDNSTPCESKGLEDSTRAEKANPRIHEGD